MIAEIRNSCRRNLLKLPSIYRFNMLILERKIAVAPMMDGTDEVQSILQTILAGVTANGIAARTVAGLLRRN